MTQSNHINTQPLARPEQAAEMLAIGKRKLWSMTNAGEIPHVRIGRAVRYDPADLHEWIASRKQGGDAV